MHECGNEVRKRRALMCCTAVCVGRVMRPVTRSQSGGCTETTTPTPSIFGSYAYGFVSLHV